MISAHNPKLQILIGKTVLSINGHNSHGEEIMIKFTDETSFYVAGTSDIPKEQRSDTCIYVNIDGEVI